MHSPDLEQQFMAFLRNEAPAIDELRTLASGQLRPALDLSPESLPLLDGFLGSLTAATEWRSSELLASFTDNPESWLAVRVAYYFGACVRLSFGCQWYLSARGDHTGETPVMARAGSEFSPLEIGLASVRGELSEGLTGMFMSVAALVTRTGHGSA